MFDRGDSLARVVNSEAQLHTHKSQRFKQFKMKNLAVRLILSAKEHNTTYNLKLKAGKKTKLHL